MKILEFINLYNAGEIKDIKTALEVKDYVSFAEKYELCSSTLEACNETDERTGLIVVDTINRNITFTITALSAYTNLEFSFDDDAEVDSIQEYDMLRENKLLKPILDTFAEEYAECKEMLETMQEDLIANNNTTVNAVLNILTPFVDALEEKLASFDWSQINIDMPNKGKK
jgi:hypothetical protein